MREGERRGGNEEGDGEYRKGSRDKVSRIKGEKGGGGGLGEKRGEGEW